MELSVVINTLNEEKNIEKALKSIKNIADEIVLVDMFSEDNTLSIAKKYNARIFSHKKTDYVEPARNYAIEKTLGSWVFVLDADEEITYNLGEKILQIIKDNGCDFVRIPRKNIIYGKWMKNSRWWPDYNIRLFKKGFVVWGDDIHSIPITKGNGLDLPADEKYALIHHHYDSISQFIERMNRYTSIQAEDKIKKGVKFKWQDLVEKPANEFFSRYYFGKGYRDGLHGLSLSLLQSFSELILYLKLWEKEKFDEKSIKLESFDKELWKNIKNLNYWKADSYIKEGGGIIQVFKRKLRLP